MENNIINKSACGRHLTFAVSNERYGINILKVQEIIGLSPITKVPKSKSYLKGVINLRGKIVPLIDLRLKFGIEEIPYNEKTCVIVVNVKKGEDSISVGVIVDTVLEVIDFAPSDVEPAPEYGNGVDVEFITGMGKRDDNLNILIDIETVLAEDTKDLKETAQEH